ncbi:hypothetical protein ABE096_13205 [Robertmurraya massiliosenegalensis]|uniref:hypothetical protein n=1 Tax=Robertmurraya TaxID=2837507 RepID=UPI0039A63375
MKHLRFGIFTFVVMMVEFGLAYLLAEKFQFLLLDSMFYVGLFFSIFFIFFSSTGGLPTNYSEISVATSYHGLKNNYKLKRTFGSLNVNCFVLGSVLFFIIGFVIAFIL